jgi:hypothetical protein
MHGVIRFHQGLFRMPLHLQLWVGMLVGANIISPLFFLEHLEARLALAAGLTGLALMSGLTGRFGFSRIVGVGHIAWLPLIAFLAVSASQVPASTPFGFWLRAVIALDVISLAFDAVDAIRFLRGDRAETVSGLEPPIAAFPALPSA